MAESVLAFLAILLFVSCVKQQPRYSTDPKTRAEMLSIYGDVGVTLQPVKGVFVEGEDIKVNYVLEARQRRVRPWYDEDIAFHTHLLHKGKEVERRVLHVDVEHQDKGTVFRGQAVLDRRFSDGNEPPASFYHLSPGDYSGFFECGVVSPVFSFKVIAAPDSLKALWADYCALRVLSDIYSSFGQLFLRQLRDSLRMDMRTVLDSAEACVLPFRNRPPGSTWRESAAVKALFLLSKYREEWQPKDSAACDALLDMVQSENADNPNIVLWFVRTALYDRLYGSELEGHLREFANRKHLREYEVELRKQCYPFDAAN